MDPKTAYPRYPQPELDNRFGIQLNMVYLQVGRPHCLYAPR